MIDLNNIHEIISTPFYKKVEFWVPVVISAIGVFFSFKAYKEAKSAKKASIDAGRTVKIQTIVIDIAELIQRISSFNEDLSYAEARNILTDITNRSHRLISPFERDQNYKHKISEIKDALTKAKIALNKVKPSPDGEGEEIKFHSVYYAIETPFSEVSKLLSELTGLFEKSTIELGE